MKQNIKEDILRETIRLIREKGSDPAKITIREICSRVGVGAGLINYHFQTKDNLIAQCVQRMIETVISQTGEVYRALPDVSPEEKLRIMAKYTCSFLAENENLSRISILTDFTFPKATDNTAQTAKAFAPLIKQSLPGAVSNQEVMRRTMKMVLTLQAFFLRGTVLKGETELDFDQKEQREQIVDMVIDSCLKE